jgi:hypothetical protein
MRGWLETQTLAAVQLRRCQQLAFGMIHPCGGRPLDLITGFAYPFAAVPAGLLTFSPALIP